MPLFDPVVIGLVLVCLLATRVPSQRLRLGVLIAASCGFWLYVDARGLLVCAAIGVFAYIAPALLRRLPNGLSRASLLALCIVTILMPMLWSRYILELPWLTSTSSAVRWVPLGISYTTFRLLSHMLDHARPRAVYVSPARHGLYALFFPIAVSGPIERWDSFAGQDGSWSGAGNVGLGLHRIITGVFKKVVIADTCLYHLTWLALPGGGHGAIGSPVLAWIAFFAYAWKVYMDFSGYTDIAIGVARLCGYRITENFDRPFLATNPADFWRRWHITLSQWIQGYLFMPVAKRWRTKLGMHIGVWVSMVLCGAWHGPSLQFVLWGAYWAAGISAWHLWSDWRRKRGSPLEVLPRVFTRALSVCCTYVYTSLSFVLFCVGPQGTVAVLKGMVGLG